MRPTVLPLARWAGYEFEVIPDPAGNDVWSRLRPAPGIYVMSYPSKSGHWMPLYIGKSKNVARRIRQHSRWVDAWARAVTEATSAVFLHVRGFVDADDLPCFERMLIGSYNPPLNDRMKSRFSHLLDPAVGPLLADRRAVHPLMMLSHSAIR